MELLNLFLWYTSTVVLGFVGTTLYAWYIEEPLQEDALLISVACQTSPIKRIHLKPNYMEQIDEMSDSSSDSDISDYFISNS